MAKKFDDLRKKMSPEAQARSKAKTAVALDLLRQGLAPRLTDHIKAAEEVLKDLNAITSAKELNERDSLMLESIIIRLKAAYNTGLVDGYNIIYDRMFDDDIRSGRIHLNTMADVFQKKYIPKNPMRKKND